MEGIDECTPGIMKIIIIKTSCYLAEGIKECTPKQHEDQQGVDYLPFSGGNK